jgi:hypothetical protein
MMPSTFPTNSALGTTIDSLPGQRGALLSSGGLRVVANFIPELKTHGYSMEAHEQPTILQCYTYRMAGIIREISQQYEKSVLSLML